MAPSAALAERKASGLLRKTSCSALVQPIRKNGDNKRRRRKSSSSSENGMSGGERMAKRKEGGGRGGGRDKENEKNDVDDVAMMEMREGEKGAAMISEAKEQPKIDPRNFDDLIWVADQIREMAGLQPGEHPRVGIICGSGLGALADMVAEPCVLPFARLPGFPQPGVIGHKGNLVIGRLSGQLCICLQGRFHPYEHQMDMALCTMPVRIMALLGVHTLIVSNAAGGLNPALKMGDLMILKDHVFLPGLMGHSPLVGLKDPRFGPRFVSMHDAYDSTLRKKAFELAEQLGAPVKEGIYVMNGGPQYETAAECAFIARIGGDAVGMSTCHEVTVARQCGIRCFGFSLITNCASLDADSPVEICHEEVLDAAQEASERASRWIAEMVGHL